LARGRVPIGWNSGDNAAAAFKQFQNGTAKTFHRLPFPVVSPCIKHWQWTRYLRRWHRPVGRQNTIGSKQAIVTLLDDLTVLTHGSPPVLRYATYSPVQFP
jgi:hypothetical protein